MFSFNTSAEWLHRMDKCECETILKNFYKQVKQIRKRFLKAKTD